MAKASSRAGDRRRSNRVRPAPGTTVRDTDVDADLVVRDLTARSLAAISPVAFPLGTSRTVVFQTKGANTTTLRAVVKRCERMGPWVEKKGQFLVVLDFVCQTPAERAALTAALKSVAGRYLK